MANFWNHIKDLYQKGFEKPPEGSSLLDFIKFKFKTAPARFELYLILSPLVTIPALLHKSFQGNETKKDTIETPATITDSSSINTLIEIDPSKAAKDSAFYSKMGIDPNRTGTFQELVENSKKTEGLKIQ